MSTHDAIVVGGGHNGLIAAVELARAGYDTLVLERNEQIGGAIRSRDDLTRPGIVHDVYSMNMNLFLGSPAYAAWKDDLERHGLRFKVSEKPYCNVFPDGRSLRVYSDVDRTRRLLREHHAADAEGWQTLHAHFRSFQQALLPLYSAPLPSLKAAGALVQGVRTVGYEEVARLAKIVLRSTRELGDEFFETPEAKALIATWGLHLDFGPDVSGGGMFPFLEAFTDMEEGMSVVEGGASHLVEALAGLIREHGGTVRTGTDVTHIHTQHGTVTGVETSTGERFRAREVVIANLTPRVLFRRLLDDAPLPPSFRDQVRRFSYGPATMMVHLALDGPAPWAAGDEIAEFAYVHIAPYVRTLADTYTAANNGVLPEDPLLIVGQPTALDPSRTPGGEHVLWIQVRVLPSSIEGDAAGAIEATDWEGAKAPMAERVLDKLERYVPGVRDRIIGQHVISPAELEAGNPNLVGGDSVGGSHHLHQNFLWRPVPGWSRYKMPIEKLYMVGAGTWPGGGNNGISGYLAARRILGEHAGGQVRRTVKRLATGAAGLGAAAGLAKFIRSRSA